MVSQHSSDDEDPMAENSYGDEEDGTIDENISPFKGTTMDNRQFFQQQNPDYSYMQKQVQTS